MQHALIVEDHPTAARWLGETLALTFAGIQTRHSGSLAEARQALAAQRPDLILLDLGLPDGDGTELLRELDHSGGRPMVIVTTIFEDDLHLYGALRAGADGYVLKEQSREEMCRLLGDILDGRPPLSPSIARRLLNHFRPGPGPQPEPVAPTSHSAEETLLSPRERDVLELIAQGLTIAACGEALGISRHTVGDHLKSIYRKLAISSRAEAARAAHRLGLIS